MRDNDWTLLYLLIVIVAGALLFVSICSSATEDITYSEYTVEQGDTLWSIAKQSNLYTGDNTRDIVKMICSESDCGTTIYAGQTLYIPQN